MLLVYTVVTALLAPLIVVHHAWRTIRRGFPLGGFTERFGWVACQDAPLKSRRITVWVHGVSVGEVLAVKPLLRRLKEEFPDSHLVVSTVTATGRAVAHGLPAADQIIYFPLDLPPFINLALERVAPDLVIIAETELWPNFLRAVRRRGIPSILVNGRISDRSFPRYCRLSWFFRPVLNDLTELCMQTAEDSRRIVAVGAPADRVHVSRNLKYDIPVRRVSVGEQQEQRARYGLPANGQVLVAASTHPGEEELLADVYLRLRRDIPDLIWVLAPRHPERSMDVTRILDSHSIVFRRRTSLVEGVPAAPCAVLLLDTVGELMTLYGLADLVVVGGSFVPVGGHNPLEPLSVGAPVVFGQFMDNFREIAQLVVAGGAGRQVQNAQSLEDVIRFLLVSDQSRTAMGEQGYRVLNEQAGATECHLAVIGPYLAQAVRPATVQDGGTGRGEL